MTAQKIGDAMGAHARQIRDAFEATLPPGTRTYEVAQVLTVLDAYIRIVENTHLTLDKIT